MIEDGFSNPPDVASRGTGPTPETAPNRLDLCPSCGFRIRDYDPEGCEGISGQRYCRPHVPVELRAIEFPDIPADAWPLRSGFDLPADLTNSQAELAALLHENELEIPCILCGAAPHAPGQCR